MTFFSGRREYFNNSPFSNLLTNKLSFIKIHLSLQSSNHV
jgi:hypothetical protein